MKRVFFKVMFVITITMGLLVTANAQPPIPVKVTPKPTKQTTKPMTESEWMKQLQDQGLQQTPPKPTTNCCPGCYPQPGVTEGGPFYPPQPIFAPERAIDYQWVKKMVNGKKYTIKLKVYENGNQQNTLTVFAEDGNEIQVDIYNVGINVFSPNVEQTGDWKKLTFHYLNGNVPVVIEIANL